ncbi:hypothetical protein BC629DRAFT_1437659 [Irpex lacteus]|nr:hypothetical protein BC629DRAFT_1437659 [Irpex lacteus]
MQTSVWIVTNGFGLDPGPVAGGALDIVPGHIVPSVVQTSNFSSSSRMSIQTHRVRKLRSRRKLTRSAKSNEGHSFERQGTPPPQIRMIHDANSLHFGRQYSSRKSITLDVGTRYCLSNTLNGCTRDDAATAQCTGGNIKRVQPDPWFGPMACGDQQLAARVPDNIAAEAGSRHTHSWLRRVGRADIFFQCQQQGTQSSLRHIRETFADKFGGYG